MSVPCASSNSIGMKIVRIEAGTFTMGQDGPPLEDYLRQKRFGVPAGTDTCVPHYDGSDPMPDYENVYTD